LISHQNLAFGKPNSGRLLFEEATFIQTAMYGSEYMAARTAMEQIIELQTTLQYLGVPIKSASYLIGDNMTVIDSSVNAASKLSKWHPPTELSIYSRFYQSSRYSEQSMGISSCLAHGQGTILGGRYHIN